MLEKSTKKNYWERCSIDEILKHLEEQIKVIKGDIPQKLLNKWKYIEQVNRNRAIVASDEIYRDPCAILEILNSMSNKVELVFLDVGKNHGFLPLKKSKLIQNRLFEIEISNPYENGKKKSIELMIDDISLKDGTLYEIHSNKYDFDNSPIAVFNSILKALQCSDNKVRLNASYSIRMAVRQ